MVAPRSCNIGGQPGAKHKKSLLIERADGSFGLVAHLNNNNKKMVELVVQEKLS